MAASRVHLMVRSMVVGIALGLAGPAGADTLLVTQVAGSAATASERPTRGTSMASVEARFGSPTSRSAAVGQPPITRWDYPGFTVYFEYDHVIHSVARRPPTAN
jgi:hypothetical protein